MFAWFDHLLAFVLVVAVPAYVGLVAWPKVKRRVAEERPNVRVRLYWSNIVFQWTLTALALLIWLFADRPAADLGLGAAGGWRVWGAAGIAAVIAGLLGAQYVLALRSAEGRRGLRAQLEEAAPFVPRDRREMRHFAAVSVTAGICEEVLYRGFLIWYVCGVTGTSAPGVAAAVVVSSVVFGLCHLYQGPRNSVRVGVLALVFGGLYVLAGALWVVMALHAAVDVAGGLLAVALMRRRSYDGRVQLQRTFDASPQEVFEAWTRPELLAKWAWGSLSRDVEAEVDLRVGGTYRLTTARQDGEPWAFSGHYLEVVSGRRLAYTVEWTAPMGYESDGERVSVELRRRGEQTEVIFVHEGIPEEAARRVHAEGWSNTFDRLAEVLRMGG